MRSLAVAHPWASASSYLSSQSLADSWSTWSAVDSRSSSRCNLHATSRTRSSHSRRRLSLVTSSSVASLSSLPRSATPPPPAGPLFSRLLAPFGAAPPSSLHILAPRRSSLSSSPRARTTLLTPTAIHLPPSHIRCSGPLSLRTLSCTSTDEAVLSLPWVVCFLSFFFGHEAEESDATDEEETRERTTRRGRPRGGMKVASARDCEER